MPLIITRRIGETFYIGDDITITVADVIGSQVKLAINAPREIAVHREEIYLKIQSETDGSPHKESFLKKSGYQSNAKQQKLTD